MKRLLVDYKKLDHHLAALLIEAYPNGYGDEDIIAFTNTQGEIVQAVELRTEDALYLVKISRSLSNFISNFEETMERELDTDQDDLGEESDMDLSLEQELEDEGDFD